MRRLVRRTQESRPRPQPASYRVDRRDLERGGLIEVGEDAALVEERGELAHPRPERIGTCAEPCSAKIAGLGSQEQLETRAAGLARLLVGSAEYQLV